MPHVFRKRAVKRYIGAYCKRIMEKGSWPVKSAPEFVKLMIDDEVDRKIQGDFFQKCLQDLLVDVLGYKSVGYVQPSVHGLDGVLRDPDGHLVVIESKANDYEPTPDTLKCTKRYGRQGGLLYISCQARKMLRPGSETHTETNAEIARGILDDLDNVRSLLIATNVSEMTTTVYELRSGKWQVIDRLKLLDLAE